MIDQAHHGGRAARQRVASRDCARVCGPLVCALAFAVLVAVGVPAPAQALEPADSITLSQTGPAYVGLPVDFSGAGAVDGADSIYSIDVVYVPEQAHPVTNCGTDYEAALAFAQQGGGGEVPGLDGNLPGGEVAQTYTYGASIPDSYIGAPGSYVACAYLVGGGTTSAVSAPVRFTVAFPPSHGRPPLSFGGPGGRGRINGFALHVAARHPIKAPGSNIIEVSGQYDTNDGSPFIAVTVKDTAKYNGCASTDTGDVQITEATGGKVLTLADQVIADKTGRFSAPVALTFRKRATGTAVICAYLSAPLDQVGEGFDRFTMKNGKQITAAKHHPTKKRKP